MIATGASMHNRVTERRDGQAQVLIIEDEASIAAMLAMVMEIEGHTAHTVRTGSAALEYLCPEGDCTDGAREGRSPHAPQLLVLDLHLGDMDGADLIKRLRARGYRVPPVILLSARQPEAVADAAFAIDAAAYFVKPPDLDLLMSSVEKVLS